MLLRCLRSEPEVFDPVPFEEGVNIITGEKIEGENKSNKKTNGVGKTLLINFIDFCLLSDYTKNRISKIPTDILGKTTNIILELSSLGHDIVIKRSRAKEKEPIIYVDGVQKKFLSLDDARNHLSKYIFEDDYGCSLRDLLSIFKRREKEGFNKIDNPDGNKYHNIIPYLYILNLDIDQYRDIEVKSKKLIETHGYISELTKDIKGQGIPIKKIGAYRNDLKAQVEKLDNAVEELSHYEAYGAISDDISKLDIEIETKGLELTKIKEELKQIDLIPSHQKVSKNDILSVYNDCKKGLGDMVVKEISEVEEFQKTIDQFKNEIIKDRKSRLLVQKNEIDEIIKDLSNRYKAKTSVLDKKGNLKSLKISLSEQQVKKKYKLI